MNNITIVNARIAIHGNPPLTEHYGFCGTPWGNFLPKIAISGLFVNFTILLKFPVKRIL